MNEGSSWHARKVEGDTFSTLNATIDDIKLLEFEPFFEKLHKAAQELKTKRENFYRSLRNTNSWWINTSRHTLSALGATALLLTAFASIVAVAPTQYESLAVWQTRSLFWAFVIYAIMGAIALFERGTGLSTAYFRHLTITIAIRNLWNQFQLMIGRSRRDTNECRPMWH